MPPAAGAVDDALAILLLPEPVEELALEEHVRGLLSIPRVLALEPGRVRTPRFMRDAAAARQAARIRLPGQLRLIILYHPLQYPLARALSAVHAAAELWYVAPDLDRGDARGTAEWHEVDRVARERAHTVLEVADGLEEERLRTRLRELDVINPHAFVPTARFARRGPRRKGSASSE
jgi:hypothetical protein